MFLLIFVLWVIFNGRFALDVVITGLLVSGAVTWFAMRYCKWYITKDWRWKGFVPGFLAYCVLLVKEIILANWQVMKLILRPDLEEQVQPQMVKFQVDIKSTIMRALLANSITLTPGTITVRAHNDHFIVHALTPEMGKDLDKSAFYTACKKLDAYVCKPDGTLEPDEEEEKTYVS